MSLDVYLNLTKPVAAEDGTGIFVRHEGELVETSKEEWNRLSSVAPTVFHKDTFITECVYKDNITHNLNTMASHAGIYGALWRPDEEGLQKASELIPLMEKGLTKLRATPLFFQQFEPEPYLNERTGKLEKWGTYEGLVRFVEEYLAACRQYPDALVSVWR